MYVFLDIEVYSNLYNEYMKVDFETNKTKLTGFLYKVNNANALIIINPATAIDISYYKYVIEYLNRKQFNVFVWNYSCFSEEGAQNLAGSLFKYSDIGRDEIPAAFAKAKELCPDLPLFCIGHSVGGQHIVFVENKKLLDGLIAVGSSAGYIWYMPLSYGLKAFFFFNVFAPITSFFYKYVPASKLNLMKDLPAPLVKEWRRWCNEKELFFSPKYYGHLLTQENYTNFEFPIHVIVADDDEICTPRNMKNFWKHIKSKKEINFHTYMAKDFSRKKLGHFGYFQKGREQIWSDIVSVLDEWRSFK